MIGDFIKAATAEVETAFQEISTSMSGLEMSIPEDTFRSIDTGPRDDLKVLATQAAIVDMSAVKPAAVGGGFTTADTNNVLKPWGPHIADPDMGPDSTFDKRAQLAMADGPKSPFETA